MNLNLNRRFVVVLTVSLVWGALVAGFFYRIVGGGGGARAETHKQIIVASAVLPVGATVTRDNVRMREMPSSTIPEGAFTRLDDVLDRPVISPIQPNEPVVAARVAARGSGLGLAPLIPSGMRAISVRVNDVVGVAGFVLPGMRVDVLVTGRPPNQNNTITRTVLQDIQVLSAGQTIQTDGKSQAITTPVVTLLVSPQQAEALTLANNEGHIQLVLRNSTDRAVAPTSGRQLNDMFAASAASPAAPVARAYAAAPPRRALPAARDAAAAPTPVRTAPPEHRAESDEMVIIRGKVKTVETFSPGSKLR